MIQKFTIEGRLPGLNEYIRADRANKYVGAKMKKTAQKTVEYFIMAAKVRPMKTPIRIVYAFIEPNRRRDQDNISSFAEKVIRDALVAQRIIPNDGWGDIAGAGFSWGVDKDRPRIEVTLIEQGEG